jgi:putative transposase
MPRCPRLDLSPEEHAPLLAALRRVPYGYLLALHHLLLCAAMRNSTAIAAVLFCSRSRMYRTVRAYRTGALKLEADAQGRLAAPVHTTVLTRSLQRSLLVLLKAALQTYGWCRTRWSCATLVLTLQTMRGSPISPATMRRWLHELGWVCKRAKPGAKDDDPHRVARLARTRWVFEQLKFCEAMVFADGLDIPLLPKVGCAWMPKGTQMEVMTPGQNQTHYLAGALDLPTGTLRHCMGARKTNAMFRDLLGFLETSYPAERYTRIYVVVDNYKIHKAKAVEQWLSAHSRMQLLFLPTYCPRANPIERAFGDVHDCCTRNHRRKRLPDLIANVEDHLHVNGPWPYQLSDLYYEPAVTAAVEKIAAEEQTTVAA